MDGTLNCCPWWIEPSECYQVDGTLNCCPRWIEPCECYWVYGTLNCCTGWIEPSEYFLVDRTQKIGIAYGGWNQSLLVSGWNLREPFSASRWMEPSLVLYNTKFHISGLVKMLGHRLST